MLPDKNVLLFIPQNDLWKINNLRGNLKIINIFFISINHFQKSFPLLTNSKWRFVQVTTPMHRKEQIPINELSREDNCLAESGSESGSFLGRCELLVVRHWGEWRRSCCNHKRLPWRETETDWKRMGFRGSEFGGDWDSIQHSQAIYSHVSLSLPGKPNDTGFFLFYFFFFICLLYFFGLISLCPFNY